MSEPVGAGGGPADRRWFEAPLWLVAGVLLVVATTWPLVTRMSTTVPQDAGDPVSQSWQVAWGGHALLIGPTSLFDANTFWPATPSLAFTDALLGYAPLGFVGSGVEAALVRYDILWIFAYALCFAAAALLGRELGLGVPAAVAVGIGYAYAPWRMAQNGHLNILSTGGAVLALFLLVAGLRRGRAWQVWAGWAVAAWQLSLGFALGIWFAYLLALLSVLAGGWWLLRGRGRWPLTRPVLVATLVGGALFALFGALLALPYLEVIRNDPAAARGVAEIQFYSPPLRSVLSADVTNQVWGGATATLRDTLRWAPEQTLFPGIAVVVLAVLGLRWRRARLELRIGLAAALVVVLALSFGFSLFGGALYRPLYDYLPGWDGLRTPGRLAFLWTLALALLAGMGVQRLADAVTTRPGPERDASSLMVTAPRTGAATERGTTGRVASVALAGALGALVLLEGAPQLPLVVPRPPPPVLATLPDPVMNLPTDPANDTTYMWWSTEGFSRIGNGNASYLPPVLAALREQTKTFPDAGSVAALRAQGFRTVALHRSLVPGTPWQDAPDRDIAGLGITRRDEGEVVVYDLG